MLLAARGGGEGGRDAGSGGGDNRGGGWSGDSGAANRSGGDNSVLNTDRTTDHTDTPARITGGNHSRSGYSRTGGSGSSSNISTFNRNGAFRTLRNGNRRNTANGYLNGGARHSSATQGGTAVKSPPLPMFNTRNSVGSRVRPTLNFPRSGPDGAALHASAVSPANHPAFVRNHMSAFIKNAKFSGQVHAFNYSENRMGHYYWHRWNGWDFCHYFDGYYNWYGWYDGGYCFWNCYYGSLWWWYDPYWSHWCYWRDGDWCWLDPATRVVYVYQDGSYQPDNGANPNNDQPVESDGNNSPVQEQSGGLVAFHSPDGSLLIKILGNGDAFLYKPSNPDFKPVFLDSNVSDVKFRSPSQGPLKVLLILKDGSFEVFSANGTAE